MKLTKEGGVGGEQEEGGRSDAVERLCLGQRVTLPCFF